MNPETLNAWINVAQLLAGIGINIGKTIGGWIHEAHPNLTPEELKAAYEAIIADDVVRAELARQASLPGNG
jgi:hypothetical protein